eukprot:TRINITY_DN51115_c0_g1_i1.p1 TRINITY_DN51115_c0_g1~~TRINITY_DN51115_c0_g1_i1.p1  ORF type:complete len:1234 (-),score=191.66 TRINITY_DN51115_c0_g1_i1:83-3562(-)
MPAEQPGPMQLKRSWEMTVQVRSFQNIGTLQKVDAFFAFVIKSMHPNKIKNRTSLLPAYTQSYLLTKNERVALDKPIMPLQRKTFSLTYEELQFHILRIDMWKVHSFSFNTYYGMGSLVLWELARRPSDVSTIIKRKLTRKEFADMKKRGIHGAPDVAVLECNVMLEELFDFRLICDNWNLELNPTHPEYKKRNGERKCLTFIMPRTIASDPSNRIKCTIHRGDWTTPGSRNFFWPKIEKAFCFRGTRSSLSNQYFCINVHSGNPLSNHLPLPASIAAALVGLTSVLDIPVFKGHVKALRHCLEEFHVGEIHGNVTCEMDSKGERDKEDIPGGRPYQPKSAVTVSHLNMREKHLVVKVTKCSGLAVAAPVRGTSDPYLQLIWDNMVQQSMVLKGTTRPVFNYTFYFPVRHFNVKCLARKYHETALRFEYASKGDVWIQVWHHEDGSSEALGSCVLSIRQLLSSKVREQRTLLGKVPKTSDEINDFAVPKNKMWYEVERCVRVLDGAEMPLLGCSLRNQNVPSVSFEAYLYPDEPPDLILPEDDEIAKHTDMWNEIERAWLREQTEFQKSFVEPFPESIGALRCRLDESLGARGQSVRRFPCCAVNPQEMLSLLPLCAFLAQITTTEEYSSPSMLLHWINNFTFKRSTRQSQSGLIPDDGWREPPFLLVRRTGPVQDHAVLLCSILRGAKRDAFVVKGTMWVLESEVDGQQVVETESDEKVMKTDDLNAEAKVLVEHVWVMTREENGWVTFWEPVTREMYHMPHRHSANQATQKVHKKRKKKQHHESDSPEETCDDTHQSDSGADGNRDWYHELPDVVLSPEQIETIPIVGRMPRAKQKAAAKTVKADRKDKTFKERENLPTAPKKGLLVDSGDDATLVDWLPYDSIEVVFNLTNLYANHQNPHPACITYDFEDPKAWSPLVKNADEPQKWKPLALDVMISPAADSDTTAWFRQRLFSEMMEFVQLYRGKRGVDTFWDNREEVCSRINDHFDILETLRKLDVDFCPCIKKDPQDRDDVDTYVIEQLKYGQCDGTLYNRYGTPFSNENGGPPAYEMYQAEEWAKVLQNVSDFLKVQSLIPVKKGMLFTGLPFHFSSGDRDMIRRSLLATTEFRDLLNKSGEKQYYVVDCKLFPLLGGIFSTWVYFGVQYSQNDAGSSDDDY